MPRMNSLELLRSPPDEALYLGAGSVVPQIGDRTPKFAPCARGSPQWETVLAEIYDRLARGPEWIECDERASALRKASVLGNVGALKPAFTLGVGIEMFKHVAEVLDPRRASFKVFADRR